MEERLTSWIWQEARKIDAKTKDKEVVLFQTGYGPSGLPHIGTFQEIVRTVMVMRAFKELTGKKTRLISFSDDLDALRKIPSNIPNSEKMQEFLGVSLCAIPNPFDTEYKSYAEHNIASLKKFLGEVGVECEFLIASEAYKSGTFNEALKEFGKKAKEIKEIVTKEYGITGSDRKDTYCPFIPIDPKTNKHTMFVESDWYIDDDKLFYREKGTDKIKSTSILDGNVKCQWKVDWPLRWNALDIDYEMHGKDLMSSVQSGKEILKLLNKPLPITYKFEMYLDEEGKKISKSKGNGLSFEEWIKYAPIDSLMWFVYQEPNKARKLFWGVIPMATDSLIKELESPDDKNKACWAIWQGKYPTFPPLSYQMLLNLVNIANTDNENVLWRYIKNYKPDINRENEYLLDKMVKGAINYYNDKIAPNKKYVVPTKEQKIIINELANRLESDYKEADKSLEGGDLADYLMGGVYEIGKNHFSNDKDALRDKYFKMLYQVIMGQDTGPRFAQFVVAYGVENSIKLLREKAK